MQSANQVEINKGDWLCLPFDKLSTTDVYDMLHLRSMIFVVEQACAYLDPDGLDQAAWHMLYREHGALLAYQRCLPPGTAHRDSSCLGRVAVASSKRGVALGRELVKNGIAFNFRTWPGQPIQIGAQTYLQGFYASLGFEVCSDPYLEDGIGHVDMRLDEAPDATL
ncbi:MAG: GNAT family N-acetyltransferase [Congregibacter sp.]